MKKKTTLLIINVGDDVYLDVVMLYIYILKTHYGHAYDGLYEDGIKLRQIGHTRISYEVLIFYLPRSVDYYEAH